MAAVAGAHVSVRREPRSSRPVRALARDLALAYDACRARPRRSGLQRRARPSRSTRSGAGHRRPAHRVAGGYFRKAFSPRRVEAVERVARALDVAREIELPEAERARAAAYVITTTEGAALHLDRLRTRRRFRSRGARPADRGRHGAGARWSTRRRNSAAGIARRCWSCSARSMSIIAPATPCTAPKIGQQTFVLDGVEMPVRANLGIYTQPISFIGLPVVAVPVPLQPLPIGVQIIAAPWREDVALRVAHALEQPASPPRRPAMRESRDGDRLARGRRRGEAAFDRYEKALVTNDVAVLDDCSTRTRARIRYGGGENLYGYRRDQGVPRRALAGRADAQIAKTVITTYGRDFAVASTLFHRDAAPRQGRPADADLGAISRRLARGRRACERDRRAAGQKTCSRHDARRDPNAAARRRASPRRKKRSPRSCGCNSPTTSCAACSRPARRSTRPSSPGASACRARRCARRSANSRQAA